MYYYRCAPPINFAPSHSVGSVAGRASKNPSSSWKRAGGVIIDREAPNHAEAQNLVYFYSIMVTSITVFFLNAKLGPNWSSRAGLGLVCRVFVCRSLLLVTLSLYFKKLGFVVVISVLTGSSSSMELLSLGPHHFLITGFLFFSGLVRTVMQTSLGTWTQFLFGTRTGRNLVTLSQTL